MSTASRLNESVEVTSCELHPASYDMVLKSLPKASANASSEPALSTTACTAKKTVTQEFIPQQQVVVDAPVTEYGQKATDKKTWPGHAAAESVLASMQSKFGNQPGPKIEESIANVAKEAVSGAKDTARLARNASEAALKGMQETFGNQPGPKIEESIANAAKRVAKDAVSGVEDTARLARDASDCALKAMQDTFGNHSDRATDLTAEQQLRKIWQDTVSDAKNTLHQAQTAFAPAKATPQVEDPLLL